ncbi:MAG: signal transduction histidine kinase [Phenylobacterium sp.]|jgi:signal transduction histidine kinase
MAATKSANMVTMGPPIMSLTTARFLQKNSIATQMLKVVFALYCVVTVVVTISQIILEYRHTKHQISDELSINQAIFEPVLSAGLWDLDEGQIQNAINGMLAIPIITGVKIEQNGQLFKAVGHIEDDDNIVHHYDAQGQSIIKRNDNPQQMFSFTFVINYRFRDEARAVGQATIYSNSSAVINRLEMGFVLLIINAVIKTIALWVLFFWVGKRILLQPLARLTNAIQNTDFNTLGSFKVDLHNHRENEITIIENAFSTMVDNLSTARNEIMAFNTNLEATVSKRTEQLTLAKEEAEQANQTKSIFMSRINHELRTPLNAILGCTQVLTMRLTDPIAAPELKLVSVTQKAGEHLLMLIEDIMDVVVMNANDLIVPLDTYSLHGIVADSVAMVQTFANENNIEITNHSVGLSVYANPGRLRQVMLNLLTNAVKYNKTQGKVTLYSHKISERYVEITIEDTGIGIAPSELSNIFEPLVRLPYAEQQCIEGSGIGLTIVKNLVEKMQGTITVTSQPGVGSKFTITLLNGKTYNQSNCSAC